MLKSTLRGSGSSLYGKGCPRQILVALVVLCYLTYEEYILMIHLTGCARVHEEVSDAPLLVDREVAVVVLRCFGD